MDPDVRPSRWLWASRCAAVAAAMMIATGCGGLAPAAGRPTQEPVCEGVPADMGGCDQDQPTFTANTCAGVGREFGVQLEPRVLALITGPASEGGESRASRLLDVVGLVTARANQYLRDEGMVADCGVEEFQAAAESQFSPQLKENVGAYIYDGTIRPYSEWQEYLARFLRVIDMGEDEPFLPEPTAS